MIKVLLNTMTMYKVHDVKIKMVLPFKSIARHTVIKPEDHIGCGFREEKSKVPEAAQMHTTYKTWNSREKCCGQTQ